MIEELKGSIRAASKSLFNADAEPELTRPDEQFGDYATNVALLLANKLNKNPREVAEQLAAEIGKSNLLQKAEVAGPGFINLTLTDDVLTKAIASATILPKINSGQEVLVEFGDPNPFKEMHIGHLYSYVIGDAISNLLEAQGANVKRLSYHGDVGLNVAKAIWAMQKDAPAIKENLGQYYADGAQAYEQDSQVKSEIDDINQHIYSQDDAAINKLHQEGSRLSFAEFDKILNLLSITTDKRYLESKTTEPGKALVEENQGTVFKESQGAIIFDGEKVGLHTRVFITSKGLPTYETKDLGLVQLKASDYPDASRSIVITANEQSEYFKVMLAALKEINPELAAKTTHLSHGFVSLSTGKMSSRTGNVFTAMDMLLTVKDAVHTKYPDSEAKKQVTFAAVKYALLKHRMGQDIVLNVDEAVSLEGNSGPYLQYAHARASSILAKAGSNPQEPTQSDLDENERSLACKISEYPEIVAKATQELMPHHICIYLYELAQSFNSFYEKCRIIGDAREAQRLILVKSYADVLKNGLGLLNITAPEKL